MQDKTKLILIADDDQDDQQILEEAFLALDKEVKIYMVVSGKEVLDYLMQCDKN